MSSLDQQIHAICDVLARDSGFVATQDAMHKSKRLGEAAREQEPPKKTALQECQEWHTDEADYIRRHYRPGFDNWATVERRILMHTRFATACREANEQ